MSYPEYCAQKQPDPAVVRDGCRCRESDRRSVRGEVAISLIRRASWLQCVGKGMAVRCGEVAISLDIRDLVAC